jgi:hypothetical protein
MTPCGPKKLETTLGDVMLSGASRLASGEFRGTVEMLESIGAGEAISNDFRMECIVIVQWEPLRFFLSLFQKRLPFRDFYSRDYRFKL